MGDKVIIIGMKKHEMKNRTKQFALRVMNVIDQLPNTEKGRVLGN